MDLRFWMDPESSLPHIFDHGVTEEEVRQVLSRTAEDFPGLMGHAFASVKRRRGDIFKSSTCQTLLGTASLS